MSRNTNGIVSKYEKIDQVIPGLIKLHNLNMFALIETHCPDSSWPPKFKGYNIISSIQSIGKSGGIAVYTRNSVKVCSIAFYNNMAILIDAQLGDARFRIVFVYGAFTATANDSLIASLKLVVNEGQVIIMLDFNHLNLDNFNLFDGYYVCGIGQHHTHTKGNRLDKALYNFNIPLPLTIHGRLMEDIADHCPIILSIDDTIDQSRRWIFPDYFLNIPDLIRKS